MSQAQPDAPVSKAFQRAPMITDYFRQRAAAINQSEGTPASQENSQPAPMTVTVPPKRGAAPILPPASSMEQPVSPPTPPGLEPTAPAAPTPDSNYLALQKQLEDERKAFAAREAQYAQYVQAQDQQLQQLYAAQAERDALKQREELQKRLANDEMFAGLETVDADDARRLIQMTADVMQQPLQEAQQQMAAQYKQMADAVQKGHYQTQQQMAAMQGERLRQELLAAHPDFFALYEGDPQFRAFLNQRNGASVETKEQYAIREYNAGNVGAVIDLLNQYKGKTPPIENIRTAAPVQVASASAVPNGAQVQAPAYTMRDAVQMFHTGQITQDQFRKMMDDLRKAAQPV